MIEYTAEDLAYKESQRAKSKGYGTLKEPKQRVRKEKPVVIPKPRKCGDGRAYDQKLSKQYRSYIMRANAKRISFELTEADFEHITGMPCVYCGTESRVGVDRMDSSEGYTLDNSQPCCGTCNIMKYRSSHSDFLKQVKRIVKHLGL